MVDVVTSEGERFKGTMMNVTAGGFDLKTEKKVKKEMTETIRSFNFEDVKSVKVIISFK